MTSDPKEFVAKIPQLNLSEGTEMLIDFSREAQRHLISARNALLILETAPNDKESIESVFKTFHTIKGLADFLKLTDIFHITSKMEFMMDLVRKDALPFGQDVAVLTGDAIKGLQKLLELLDEQISNEGKLQNPYYDVGPLVDAIQRLSEKKPLNAVPSRPSAVKALAAINFEPDLSVHQEIIDIVAKNSETTLSVPGDLLRKLIADFKDVSRELKEARGKLQERQRELVKERELAIRLTHQAQGEARGKSEYLANVSHEIRTLINAIMGFTDLLRESPLTAKQQDHLGTIIMSGKMLLEIVNDILDFSKVEAGKLKLEKIDFDLEHIIEDVFKITRSRLVNKPIQLYFAVADDVPRGLVGDPTRLKQIFMNLLDNAIKFTDGGEVGMTVNREAGGHSKDDHVVIRFVVEDTGVGIPANRQQALFQSFVQASDSTTRIYGGTGLGLALCKTFVEKMGGHIRMESVLGKGTTFIFTIPFPQSQQPSVSPAVLHDLKLDQHEFLLVSDNERTGTALLALATRIRIKPVIVLQTVKQASEFLLKREEDGGQQPAVIFIDTTLPGKEAFMLAYKIREREKYQHIRLVALTPDPKIEAAAEFQEAGFDASLMKPVIKTEVFDILVMLLSQKPTDRRMIRPDVLNKISCEGTRVLVVEDSVPNRELLKIHLEALGCAADYAVNGQEAIDFLKKGEYDICLMDLQMPVIGGLEATQMIRKELKNNVPIIALTAAEIQEEREKCLASGMNDYLPKPFDPDELKEKIIKCMKM